jgi:hypothetical protein
MKRLLVVAACLASFATPSMAHAGQPMVAHSNEPAHSAPPLAVFNSLISYLATKQIPVYLPSWLPPSLHLYKLTPKLHAI